MIVWAQPWLESLALSFLRSKLLLSLKVACSHIIGLNHELVHKQVMPPCAKTMHHYGNLFSYTMYRLSVSLSFRLLKAMAWSSRIKTLAIAKLKASMCSSNGLLRSGRAKINSSIMAFFRTSKAFWHSWFYVHPLHFFNNSVRGAAIVTYPLINRH